MERFEVGLLPVLVTIMVLARPEVGVPDTPYSVYPVLLKAKLLTLVLNVVVLVTQTTEMLVTFEPPMMPLPLLTVQNCVAGWVCTVT